jgi:hypothetical protein
VQLYRLAMKKSDSGQGYCEKDKLDRDFGHVDTESKIALHTVFNCQSTQSAFEVAILFESSFAFQIV